MLDVYGTSLVKYCKEKNLPYAKIWYRMSVKGMNIHEAIEDVRSSKNKPHHCNHWVNGVTLRQYCKANKINYEVLLNKMKRRKCTPEEALNERLQETIS